ncbi:MAG TPA: hypothetical protein VME47_16750 [Acetobacteraceae bacterium]|nr:hypothetical protein [Acetobacteraceae bacterium]
MRITKFVRIGVLAAPLVCLGTLASAQIKPPSDSNVTYQGLLKQKHSNAEAPPPPVAAPPSAWPRLDPGSVICRGLDDLQRRAALMRGEQTAPPDCQPITQPTAVKILDRSGPGATEVQITSNGETGWTDAWLPANPPPGETAAR